MGSNLNNRYVENIRMARYMDKRIPRAGDSIPKESITQLLFRSKPEHTGINTTILSTSDNLGNSMSFDFMICVTNITGQKYLPNQV